jgi:hypothetical protein
LHLIYRGEFPPIVNNCISGVMVSVHDSSAVDRMFKPKTIKLVCVASPTR